MKKHVPFKKNKIQELAKSHPTPFYIYDEAGIRAAAQTMNGAFSWVPGYKNYFAVKALPNPEIMRVLASEGMGFDASSLAELELCAKLGVRGDQIMFTSNNTSVEEYSRALELGTNINFDDISEIEFFDRMDLELPELVSFRYNPGSDRVSGGNDIIGQPEEAKFGLTHPQLLEAYAICQKRGSTRFGIHTMVVSNELRSKAIVETAKMIFDVALELKQKLGIELEYADIGGGFGIPYRPDEESLDVQLVSDGIRALHLEMIEANGLKPIRIVTENGRYVTGPSGYLVTTVKHFKNTYKSYVGVDANMANLMRPGMYGAYHHISVLGKEEVTADQVYDVVGSLCENNDKLAVARHLPQLELGDILVIHDAGAHGHSMGFNYNGKLRSAEFLLQQDGKFKIIRRAETLDDYFATLEF